MFTTTIAALFLSIVASEGGIQHNQFHESYQTVLEGRRWDTPCEPGADVGDLIISYRSHLRYSDYPSAVRCAKLISTLNPSSISDDYRPYVQAITSRISALEKKNRTYVVTNKDHRSKSNDCPISRVKGTSWYVRVSEECLVLLVDTGATVSMVNERAGKLLHIPPVQGGFSQIPEIPLGSAFIHNALVGVLSDEQAAQFESVGIDGVIGLHALVNGVIVSDDNGFITFASRDAIAMPTNGSTVNLQYDGATLKTVPDGDEVTCLIDSGASISIIPRSMLLDGTPSDEERITLVGVNGNQDFQKVENASFTLGSSMYDLTKVASPEHEECVIGIDFMFKYLSYMDIRSSYMMLEKGY